MEQILKGKFKAQLILEKDRFGKVRLFDEITHYLIIDENGVRETHYDSKLIPADDPHVFSKPREWDPELLTKYRVWRVS